MDNMFRDRKNLKDSSSELGISLKDTQNPLSYTKTEKLITALYMVTDIIDKDEPLRNKLRTLGTDIISDINSHPALAIPRIAEIMSFLDIAQAMHIISQMNTSILRKEFLEMDQSIRELSDVTSVVDAKIDLTEFFSDEGQESHPSLLKDRNHRALPDAKGSQGHGHKLGLQKDTHPKSAKDVSHSGSDKMHEHVSHAEFDQLKKHRRQDIVNIIKIVGGSSTIKDIKDKADSLPDGAHALKNCGEKTLQRELADMVSDGVLKKIGQKRWSKYLVN